MPNHTYNILSITGNRRTLQRVYKALKGSNGELTFNNIVPCPAELMNDDWQNNDEVAKANVAKHGYSGWYDWRVAKWGTKWEAYNVQFQNGDSELRYTFDTAWSPPSEFVAALSKRFPSLDIEIEAHEEAGMWESFIARYKAGELIAEEQVKNINLTDAEEMDD